MSDYYAILGVTPNATDDEIKRAYRELARRYHPDTNQHHPEADPDAEERFKEISQAYDTLRDPERRRRYDTFGEAGGRGSGGAGDGFGNLGDVFEAFFGGGDPFGARRGPSGPQRGADAEAVVELTLEEAAFGSTHTFDARLPSACARCEGSGCEPGTHPSRCDVCEGSGEIRQLRRSLLGQIVTASPCGACAGTGRRILSPCQECRGDGRIVADRTIDVEVPAGVDNGQRLRLTGRGGAAPRGGPPGDLYVTIRVQRHPAFDRDGNDLVHGCKVSIAQAALGAQLEVPTLDGVTEVTVSPGTQPGDLVRVKGQGVPSLRGRGRGDLIVRFDVEVPTRLTDEERELLAQFATLRGETVANHDKGFFARLRSTS